MIILDEYRLKTEALRRDAEELGKVIDIEKLKSRQKEIEEISADPNFWNDAEESRKILTE